MDMSVSHDDEGSSGIHTSTASSRGRNALAGIYKCSLQSFTPFLSEDPLAPLGVLTTPDLSDVRISFSTIGE